ncbi:MAG: DUF393 domain-containing protein [Leptospiraceae bacterium]
MAETIRTTSNLETTSLDDTDASGHYSAAGEGSWNLESVDGELKQGPIVFFDGVCNICNQSVNTLLKLDRKGRLRYASLQGGLARYIFGALEGDPDSMKIAVPRKRKSENDRSESSVESRSGDTDSESETDRFQKLDANRSESNFKAARQGQHGNLTLNRIRVFEGYQAFLQVGGIIYPLLKPLAYLLSWPPFSWIGRGLYSFIAANRYKWFGKRDFCDISNLRFKDRFID